MKSWTLIPLSGLRKMGACRDQMVATLGRLCCLLAVVAMLCKCIEILEGEVLRFCHFWSGEGYFSDVLKTLLKNMMATQVEGESANFIPWI